VTLRSRNVSVGNLICRVETFPALSDFYAKGALLELSQQASSCDSRRPAISSGRPHGFGHIPSSLRSFEHIRKRRKAHLKSLPSRGGFCYCHLSVGLAQGRAQSWPALCVRRP